MTKHLEYTLIGGILFLITTIVVLWFSDTGIHNGFWDAVSSRTLFQSSLRTAFWIGVLSGGISSIVLRKSVNRKVYVWIALIFTLILTEVVIITLV